MYHYHTSFFFFTEYWVCHNNYYCIVLNLKKVRRKQLVVFLQRLKVKNGNCKIEEEQGLKSASVL